jgi:hypothetical protein
MKSHELYVLKAYDMNANGDLDSAYEPRQIESEASAVAERNRSLRNMMVSLCGSAQWIQRLAITDLKRSLSKAASFLKSAEPRCSTWNWTGSSISPPNIWKWAALDDRKPMALFYGPVMKSGSRRTSLWEDKIGSFDRRKPSSVRTDGRGTADSDKLARRDRTVATDLETLGPCDTRLKFGQCRKGPNVGTKPIS